MWPSRLLCAFGNAPWADRHCSAPNEEDSHSNVFDRGDDGNDGEDGNDGGSGDGGTDYPDGRNTTDDDSDGDGGGDPDVDNPQNADEETRAPTRAPANLSLRTCNSSQEGSFFVTQTAENSRSTAKSTMVAFAYQVQGTIDLDVALLRATVLPALERELSAALVPALFAPEACRLTAEQQLAQQPVVSTYNFVVKDEDGYDGDVEYSDRGSYNDSGTRGRRKRMLGSFANAPVDAPVTGLEASPADRLLPNYEGVRCRTELVDEADRCFIVSGAFTISGPADVDWAVSAAQATTEQVMNESRSLDQAHPSVKHVLYLQALDADDQPWLFDGGPPVLVDQPESEESDLVTSAARSWIVVAAALTVLLTALMLIWRRQRRRGAYDDSRQDNCCSCCTRRRSTTRITRGYLAYPSPDRSPDQRLPPPSRQSVWLSDNPAVPSDHSSQDFLASPPLSWTELNEEPVSSFDPVIGPPMASRPLPPPSEPMPPQHVAENTFTGDAVFGPQDISWHDGSFPVLEDIPPPAESVVEDVEFGNLSFYDDYQDENFPYKDGHSSSPKRPWLRDFV